MDGILSILSMFGEGEDALLTIHDLLSLDVFEGAKVLAGGPWLNRRQIDWISVIEVPVEDFIRRDEFVLSTGLGCGYDPHLFLSFVEEVIQAGAAGLAIAVGRHVSQVPQDVIELAETRHFPLLEIPWDVRFADISRRVFSELSMQNIGDSGADLIRQMLFRIAKRDSIVTIIKTIEKFWDLSCVFFDAQKALWYGSPRLVQWCNEHQGQIKRVIRPPVRGIATMSHQTISSVIIEGQEVGLLPVQSTVRWFGTLLLFSEPNRGWSPERFSHREAIMEILSLVILIEETAFEDESHVREDFVWKLAKGEFKTWDDLLEASGTVRCDISQYYTCVVGRLGNMESLYRYSQTVFRQQTQDEWESQIVRIVQKSLATAAKAFNYDVLSTYQRGEWIIYFVSAKRIDMKAIHQLLDAAEAAVRLHLDHFSFSWGIAGAIAGTVGFHHSFQNARMALETSIRRQGAGCRLEYERVNNQQVLAQFSQDQAMREVVQATMGTLIEYDRQHGTDLVHTVTSYLLNRTNVSLTARRLHLHRQSLLYRLNKIESLTGRSLDNPDDLFLLELCSRILGVTDTLSMSNSD